MKKIFLVLLILLGNIIWWNPAEAKVCLCNDENKKYCFNVDEANINECSDYCHYYDSQSWDAGNPAASCNEVGGYTEKSIPNLPEPATCMCDNTKCIDRLQNSCDQMSDLLSEPCISVACSVNYKVSGSSLVPMVEQEDVVADKTCRCGNECRLLQGADSCAAMLFNGSFCTVVSCVEGTIFPDETPASSSGSGSSVTSTINTVVSLTNPLAGNKTDIPTIIGTVIKGVMGVMGALVLLMFVWGGFTWLTSAGNPEKVKQGTQTIIWAAIGALLAVSSYVILNTILNAFTGNLIK